MKTVIVPAGDVKNAGFFIFAYGDEMLDALRHIVASSKHAFENFDGMMPEAIRWKASFRVLFFQKGALPRIPSPVKGGRDMEEANLMRIADVYFDLAFHGEQTKSAEPEVFLDVDSVGAIVMTTVSGHATIRFAVENMVAQALGEKTR